MALVLLRRTLKPAFLHASTRVILNNSAVAYKRKFIGIYMYFFYSQLNARKEHTMMLPLVPAKIARLITSALWRVQQCVNNALVTRPLWKRYPKPALAIMFFSMLYVFCKKVVINSYIGRLDHIS